MTRAVIGLRGVSGHAGEAASLSSAGPLINYIRIPPDRRPSDPGRAALLARATRSTLRPPQRLPARPKSASKLNSARRPLGRPASDQLNSFAACTYLPSLRLDRFFLCASRRAESRVASLAVIMAEARFIIIA